MRNMAEHRVLTPEMNILSLIQTESRLVCISIFIALAQFQYGYDSAAVSGFQSMPGFLKVFGYFDVSALN
jgi:SP family sugar:H+ symporter-like MFS transporter